MQNKRRHLSLKAELLIITLAIVLLSIVLGIAAAVLYTRQLLIPAILVLLATILLASVVTWRVAHILQSALNMIKDSVRRLGRGDFDVEIEFAMQGDIDDLCGAVNDTAVELKQNVIGIATTLDLITSGKIHIVDKRSYAGDFTRIQNSMRQLSEILLQNVSLISSTSREVTDGSEQVASASQSLAQGATEQASSIQELSAAILDVSEQVKQNASDALDANSASALAHEKIQDVAKETENMMQAMAEITSSSNQIGNIIKTINDIARQTNILALNAAVEAARAGSAGKGFAVVAEEVRNLASKSAEAAQNSTALIENSIQAVEKGKDIADQTVKTMQEVLVATEKSTDLVNRIASASEAQSTSISQISLGVDQISSVVQTNSATAEESAASSQEMADHAVQLQRLVEYYSLDEVVVS